MKITTASWGGGGSVVELQDPDREVEGLNPMTAWPYSVLQQDTLRFPKYLKIPRKQWLHHKMTEILLIRTLNKNQSFPKFSAVQTPNLMYDIKERDNKHRTCYIALNIKIWKLYFMSLILIRKCQLCRAIIAT